MILWLCVVWCVNTACINNYAPVAEAFESLDECEAYDRHIRVKHADMYLEFQTGCIPVSFPKER